MGDTALLLILMIMFPTSAPVGCSDFSEIGFIRSSSGGFFFLGKPTDNSGTNQEEGRHFLTLSMTLKTSCEPPVPLLPAAEQEA